MMISPLSFAQPVLSFPVKRLAYNPGIHHRRSIRLKGYNYSQGGSYFVTINIRHRKCLLGTVENGEMTLNDFGIIACQQWEKLPERFSNIELDVFQIMPNHMHGILLLTDAASVGAGLVPAQPAPAIPGNIVGAYKSQVANCCLELFKQKHPEEMMGKLWKRNYHEHIIRNEQSFHNIADYIIRNPANWNNDPLYNS